MTELAPDLVSLNHHTVGVDLGGTNMRLAVYRNLAAATEPPRPAVVRRTEVGDRRRPEQIVEDLCRHIVEMLGEAEATELGGAVGIGLAGMMRGKEGVVAISPHLEWRDVPFGDLMRDRLGPEFSITVENDVNAATYGEWALGAGAGADDVLAVFVGTGIGAGIVAAGQLVTGATGCAAELGHVTAVWSEGAAPCACGLRGCIEAYVGGSYLQRRIRAELAGGARSLAVELAGGRPEAVTPGHLDLAAAEGDEYALGIYTEVAPLLGVVLGNAVTTLNPARLILGGGMLSRTPVLREHVIAALEIAANPPALAGLAIVEAALGDDAGLIGSALLGLRDRMGLIGSPG